MSYKTLLVQLELGRSNAAPIGVARSLASRLDLAVSGVGCAQPIQSIVGDAAFSSVLVRQDSASLKADAEAAQQEFRAGLEGNEDRLAWSFFVADRPLSEQIAKVSGFADLVVVGIDQRAGEFSNYSRRVDIGDLLMQAGRPLLLVPLVIEHFNFRCAVVAWKDTREARRALTDALPLLASMDRIIVAEIGYAALESEVKAGLDRVVAWLGRHDIAAVPHFLPADGDESDQLMTLAEESGAELIVAGAYGHSRFREWVLGGVTHDLLHEARCCLFLSH